MESSLVSKPGPLCAPDVALQLEMTELDGVLGTQSPFPDAEAPKSPSQRAHRSRLKTIGAVALVLLGPPYIIFTWVAVSVFDGALGKTRIVLGELGVSQFLAWYGPALSFKAYAGYVAWLLFQAGLYVFLPSSLSLGQVTLAGQVLKYRMNGIWAWTVSQVLFALVCASQLVDPAVIARNWGPLLAAANVYGILLSIVAYGKAYLYPNSLEDRKFSGSWTLDFLTGIELNPRFGRLFDLKFISSARQGIIAWTLIDISYIAYQYQLHGSFSHSMIVVGILHNIYIIDFFLYEEAYLRTVDICHRRFGFYFAWGWTVWVPATYTLQTQYLARRPIELNIFVAILILCVGLAGIGLYRSANHQKELARLTKGECTIWGHKAEVIKCSYQTSDGSVHESLLLCSGWWRVARHMNYIGILVFALSTCAACGFRNLLPWTHTLFIAALVLYRVWSVEQHCAAKYGTSWSLYCANVRWKLIPGLY